MTAAGVRRARPPEPLAFVRDRTEIRPVRSLPEIRLHTAHRTSGLWRLAADGPELRPPFWAFPWAGGMALARFLLDRPATVAGRRVLDLGAGSGLVAIAAALAGAATVSAAEIDPYGRAALGLNAALNGVVVTAIGEDVTGGPPAEVDLVLVGDLFYEPGLAARVTGFLDACAAAGAEVLIGDPYRAHLPRSRLRLIAEYPVSDFGEIKPGGVFAFQAAPGK